MKEVRPKMKRLFKKAQQRFTISDLTGVAIAIMVAAIVLGVGATILDNIQTTQTVNSTGFNTTGSGLTGLNTLASYIPTIALVAVAAIVVGIVLVFFSRRNS